jgi:hypothetical protein
MSNRGASNGLSNNSSEPSCTTCCWVDSGCQDCPCPPASRVLVVASPQPIVRVAAGQLLGALR